MPSGGAPGGASEAAGEQEEVSIQSRRRHGRAGARALHHERLRLVPAPPHPPDPPTGACAQAVPGCVCAVRAWGRGGTGARVRVWEGSLCVRGVGACAAGSRSLCVFLPLSLSVPLPPADNRVRARYALLYVLLLVYRACSSVVIALRFDTQGPGFEPGLFHKACYMPLHGC
jgi:hypothetical protein